MTDVIYEEDPSAEHERAELWESIARGEVTQNQSFGKLFLDRDGDLCIEGRDNNLIACPAADDAANNWRLLNPDVFPEIVRRWNAGANVPEWSYDIDAAPENQRLLLTVEVDGKRHTVIGGYDPSWSGKCWVYDNPRVKVGTLPLAWAQLALPAAAAIAGERT